MSNLSSSLSSHGTNSVSRLVSNGIYLSTPFNLDEQEIFYDKKFKNDEQSVKSNRKDFSSLSSVRRKDYYTIAGRSEIQSRQFSQYYYQQIGSFLTQYKIKENYNFLQMISVPPLDPAVPKPEGGISIPACGEPLLVPASFPQSLEAAIHKFANASSKTTCISVIDQNGKPINSLTYGNFDHLIDLN